MGPKRHLGLLSAACSAAVLGCLVVGRGGANLELAEVEWPGGSARWAQSATPLATTEAGINAPGGLGSRWGAWATSQSFLPSRLTEPPAEPEMGGSEAVEREVGGSEAAAADTRDKLVRDAQALIKDAGTLSAENIMRDEAAALEPMYFRQSGAQRQMRAAARAAAAAAAAERARQLDASAAAAAAARDKELETQGIVRKGQKSDDVLESGAEEPDSAEPASPDDAQAVQEEERREAYRAKGFSPTRRDFAGSGATWGFEPAGYNPLDTFGWRVQRVEAAPPAAARDENSVSPPGPQTTPYQRRLAGLREMEGEDEASGATRRQTLRLQQHSALAGFQRGGMGGMEHSRRGEQGRRSASRRERSRHAPWHTALPLGFYEKPPAAWASRKEHEDWLGLSTDMDPSNLIDSQARQPGEQQEPQGRAGSEGDAVEAKAKEMEAQAKEMEAEAKEMEAKARGSRVRKGLSPEAFPQGFHRQVAAEEKRLERGGGYGGGAPFQHVPGARTTSDLDEFDKLIFGGSEGQEPRIAGGTASPARQHRHGLPGIHLWGLHTSPEVSKAAQEASEDLKNLLSGKDTDAQAQWVGAAKGQV